MLHSCILHTNRRLYFSFFPNFSKLNKKVIKFYNWFLHKKLLSKKFNFLAKKKFFSVLAPAWFLLPSNKVGKSFKAFCSWLLIKWVHISALQSRKLRLRESTKLTLISNWRSHRLPPKTFFRTLRTTHQSMRILMKLSPFTFYTSAFH